MPSPSTKERKAKLRLQQTLSKLAAYVTDRSEGSWGLMAGKVIFSVSMLLDGFIAPKAVPVEDVFSPFFRVLLDKAAIRWPQRGAATQIFEVDIREELLKLLKRSRLGARPVAEQVRVGLAVHLLQEGVIQRTSARHHEAMAGWRQVKRAVFARHCNPWSAWTRWASAPLVLVSVWRRSWRKAALVGV